LPAYRTKLDTAQAEAQRWPLIPGRPDRIGLARWR